jgi:anti-anti-sigma factor
MALFKAETTAEADQVVVRLTGECDLSVREELTAALLSAVEQSPMVVVDLAGLSFLDSSGLHGLVTAYHAANARVGHLYAVNARGVVADILDLTGIGDLLSRP